MSIKFREVYQNVFDREKHERGFSGRHLLECRPRKVKLELPSPSNLDNLHRQGFGLDGEMIHQTLQGARKKTENLVYNQQIKKKTLELDSSLALWVLSG